MTQSVCLYHNGNSRVITQYRNMLPNLQFKGNWANKNDQDGPGCLYEICFADATWQNLHALRQQGVSIWRHISAQDDDQEHWLFECGPFDASSWLQNAVINNLCFADRVISEMIYPYQDTNETVIITTGRTANTHLRKHLKTQGVVAFENEKIPNTRFFNAKSAIMLWRIDQWACLCSIWIALNQGFMHKEKNRPEPKYDTVPAIDPSWIENNWKNMCQSVLDQAMFFRHVLNKKIEHSTTEQIVLQIQTSQEKIPYDKKSIITDHDRTQLYFEKSTIKKQIDLLYNHVSGNLNTFPVNHHLLQTKGTK